MRVLYRGWGRWKNLREKNHLLSGTIRLHSLVNLKHSEGYRKSAKTCGHESPSVQVKPTIEETRRASWNFSAFKFLTFSLFTSMLQRLLSLFLFHSQNISQMIHSCSWVVIMILVRSYILVRPLARKVRADNSQKKRVHHHSLNLSHALKWFIEKYFSFASLDHSRSRVA
jgi:hypothetical protein